MDTTPKILASEPLVSVLLLTYNRATFLPAAIMSVLTQSYQNIELIIIDDGSTDATPGVVRAIPDPRIKYIRHEDNAGIVVRRIESLTYATGDYIAIIDSDDMWFDTEKLNQQVAHMQTHLDCVVVGTFISLISTDGVTIGKTTYQTTDAAIRRRLLWRNQFAHSSVLLRKDAVSKTEGYRDFPIGEDLDLFLQLGQHGSFANLPFLSTAYRIHQAKATAEHKKTAREVLKVIAKHRRFYPHYWLAKIKFAALSQIGD